MGKVETVIVADRYELLVVHGFYLLGCEMIIDVLELLAVIELNLRFDLVKKLLIEIRQES